MYNQEIYQYVISIVLLQIVIFSFSETETARESSKHFQELTNKKYEILENENSVLKDEIALYALREIEIDRMLEEERSGRERVIEELVAVKK